LLQLHPQVRRVFHENFLLKTFHEKQALLQFIEKRGIDTKKDNWGEKVPYYPSARKFPIVKYCEQWDRFFGKNSKILHIVRHPYDVALSNVRKFKNINTVEQPLTIYKKIVPVAVKKIDKRPSVFTFKYEDLITDPDRMLFDIYKHCKLKPDINFRKKMRSIANSKYQKIDPSRAFSYLEQNINWTYDMSSVIDVLNEVDGVKYEL
jgi:hypothetical protein